MKRTSSTTQIPNTARPIAHLVTRGVSATNAQAAPALPKADTSVNKEVANVAVTGYN